MTRVLELFGHATNASAKQSWKSVAQHQECPYLGRKCLKIRKSNPDVSIGTCTVAVGEARQPTLICPYRRLERRQVFQDSVHLLTLHEPGNQLHVVPEITVPGGSIDYFVVSVRRDKVVDFAGIEFQTLDTTGTVWPERQRFLASVGLPTRPRDLSSSRPFGMNWKMTAKTTLVQLHHKIGTLEHLSRRLVLVLQDSLLSYMRGEFSFDHLSVARTGDSMQFHAYRLVDSPNGLHLELAERLSTDSDGIAIALRQKTQPHLELDALIQQLQRKISKDTPLSL